MAGVTRRLFLAGLGSTVAAPRIAKSAINPDFDVIIIGAGAAGIAAARRLARSGKTFAVLEASDRLGGRCFTDTRTFGGPYDQGAYSLHETDSFPVADLAAKAGLEIHKTPVRTQLRTRTRQKSDAKFRSAREYEVEDFYVNLSRCDREIVKASLLDADVSCAQALPKDMGSWRSTMDFMLGPFAFGSELTDMSVKEYVSSNRPEQSVRVRQGIGTLFGRLAHKSPIQFFSPVSRIEWGSQAVAVETRGKRITAHSVIITASTGVLASDKISFNPSLPVKYAEAINKLKLGSCDRVAIELADNQLGLPVDEILFEKAAGRLTAAGHTNFLSSRLCYVQVGGKCCADLADEGEAAQTAFAVDWLVAQFGSGIRKSIKRTHATRWNKQPWALGAFSYASPGGRAARKVLSQPLSDRIWFAGEAVHESLWGTVAGAWETGERAANAVLEFGPLPRGELSYARSKSPPIVAR
jgi:monoamine oxidase